MRLISAVSAFLLVFLGLVALPRRPSGVVAGTAVRMGIGELARDAALIVEGRVLSTAVHEEGGRIETEYLLAVDRTLAGESRSLRTIRMPGGVLADGRGMLLAGMPRIAEGESVLLFLTESSPSGIQMPVGLSQGKFRLLERADGSRIAVRSASDVALLQPDTGALFHGEGRMVVEYAELVAEIEASRAGKR